MVLFAFIGQSWGRVALDRKEAGTGCGGGVLSHQAPMVRPQRELGAGQQRVVWKGGRELKTGQR